ncbi:MAG: dehydrogenase [Bacteroidales bacterium]|nr:dehydrogenase [Bacteroidales bacterium]
MIIRSKAPLRLGLAGGGSDVSPYSDLYGGLVLNATINLSAYCTIETLEGETVVVDAYDADTHVTCPFGPVLEGAPDLIRGVYARIVKDFGPVPGAFSITTYNDAPAGSGLGTSSTMVVCILKCFAEWMNLPLGDYEIARLAYEIERKDLALAGGKQDQYAAAFGGFNYMEFLPDDIVIVNPLKIKGWIVDELESSMVLYYTGRSRSSAAIISEQQKNTSSGNATAIEAMHRIKQSSKDMKFALLKGDMAEFGRILGQAWEDKKKMAGAITNPVIQEAFDTALGAGAVAGKVSGAGGGGFMMLMVPPARKMAVVQALSRLPGQVMPFQFTERGAHAWRVYPTDKVPEIWKR